MVFNINYSSNKSEMKNSYIKEKSNILKIV